MPTFLSPVLLTWGISALAVAGVITRPFRLPEAVWAVLGAAVIAALGLMPLSAVWNGIARGTDVYLFLIGMMLLSELARKEGLFDWLAAIATRQANGSPKCLFFLIYAVGVLVTVFLSNDATAVVLTPAVYAATRAAKVANPLPYLLICAFIANAASFVLPISNPANLVIFGGGEMPPLGEWLRTFTLPSIVAIVVTYLALAFTQRRALASETVAADVPTPSLSPAARVAGIGLALTAIGLVIVSALDLDLGLPTFVAGIATTLLIVLVNREPPLDVLKGISWSVLPLVAGLFVIVEALSGTGLVGMLGDLLARNAAISPAWTAGVAGVGVGFAANLVNNLPAGLFAGSAVQAAGAPSLVAAAILIGVDLGPNLSVTGSLATILWLTALRREGIEVGTWQFLKLGAVVMIPALLLSIATLIGMSLL
ncbi:arsenite efflux membrane protein ArsB [Rhizobium sp. PP-F2F-G48]|uniref:arsenic transporter n=1 Tax=Rhizobium sp. PP-F2F-G48 TaxID=2135651 RepID=UPI00104A0A57|nr:arsenic transporter [Rhizobium sp. PP-F2F-G48]TCM54242.1 arsenite efflux membrane protein ArsB [Rhizobium sp. PP-F2F-G48]